MILVITVSIIFAIRPLPAQWVQTDGPYGGNIHCFAVSGTNLFAGTSRGIFLSTNNGTSWTEANAGLTNTYINCFAVSGTNIFAGSSGGGVFISDNNGEGWSDVNIGLTNTYINCLAVSGTNLFAGTYGGVFISTNNGDSWTEVNAGLTNTNVHALAVSGTKIFAGTWGGGVFLSTNNGDSWTEVNTGLTNTEVHALADTRNRNFCRNLWRCFSFHQQWYKLDRSQYRIDGYLLSIVLLYQEQIFLQELGSAFFYPPTTVQAGQKSIQD